MRAALIEGHEQVLLKEAPVRQRRVDRGARVALGADEPVPSGHFGIFRVDAHFLEIQHRQQLRQGEGAAQMPHPQMADGGQGVAADVFADFLQVKIQIQISFPVPS